MQNVSFSFSNFLEFAHRLCPQNWYTDLKSALNELLVTKLAIQITLLNHEVYNQVIHLSYIEKLLHNQF